MFLIFVLLSGWLWEDAIEFWIGCFCNPDIRGEGVHLNYEPSSLIYTSILYFNAIHYNLLYLIIFFDAHSSFIPQYTCLHWKIRYQSFITQRVSLITHANTLAFFELCKWNYLWVITQHCLCTGGILSPYRDNFLRSLADICVLITQSIAWKSYFYVKLFLFSMKNSLICGTEWNTSLPWVSLKISCLLKILGYVYTFTNNVHFFKYG